MPGGRLVATRQNKENGRRRNGKLGDDNRSAEAADCVDDGPMVENPVKLGKHNPKDKGCQSVIVLLALC